MDAILSYIIFFIIPRPPRSTRTDTLFPYTTLFRSHQMPLTAACGDARCRYPNLPAMPAATRRPAETLRYWSSLQKNWAPAVARSEEHTSELQSLMRISYAVFCLKKKNKTQHKYLTHISS